MENQTTLAPMEEVKKAVNGVRLQYRKRIPKFSMVQRPMYQAAQHLEAVLERVWDWRTEAGKLDWLIDLQDLTEAIYHLAQTRAYLDRIAKRHFGRSASDLEVYK